MTEFVPAQTSVPDWLMTYCRQLADVHYSRKLNRMYVHMLQGFLAFEPWNAKPPFPWRVAKIHGSSGARTRKGTDPGWVPMNMVLPVTLHDQITHTIERINLQRTDEERVLSLRTFLYTAVCWWCTSVYPYRGPGMLNE
ncbi:MAG TPA: hypothetical protein VJ654_12845 [Noviherbaspirillum sp.]|nr:hypothetical protein [Noviherbaspirillum sp.]